MKTITLSKYLSQKSVAFYTCFAALWWLNVPWTLAHAEATSPLNVQLTQFKVGQDRDGRPVLTEAAQIAPGDLLEYKATYSNQGTEPLAVIAVLPVPQSMEYVPNSALHAAGFRHEVAQQDQRFAAEPLKFKVPGADNSQPVALVPYANYRFVQWDLGSLAPGTSVEVRLRASVSGISKVEKKAIHGG